jgi:hypothetical protein
MSAMYYDRKRTIGGFTPVSAIRPLMDLTKPLPYLINTFLPIKLPRRHLQITFQNLRIDNPAPGLPILF